MKHWYQSKTVWFNVLTVIAAISSVALLYVGKLGMSEPQQALAGMSLTMVNTLGNIYLRLITDKAIK